MLKTTPTVQTNTWLAARALVLLSFLLLLSTCRTAIRIDDDLQPGISSIVWTPLTPSVGESVKFTAQYRASEPRTFGWIIGGGSGQQQSSIESPTFEFTQAGRHAGTLTLTNGQGITVTKAFSFDVLEQ